MLLFPSNASGGPEISAWNSSSVCPDLVRDVLSKHNSFLGALQNQFCGFVDSSGHWQYCSNRPFSRSTFWAALKYFDGWHRASPHKSQALSQGLPQ